MVARLLCALFALMLPVAAQAAGAVALSSKVFLEKVEMGSDGRARTILHKPDMVTPGDTLVFIVDYRNASASSAADFVVTNPVPPAIAYRGTADGSAQVSIDGGKSWGSLAALSVRQADGRIRSARPDDVTHIRWAMAKPIPAGAQGKLSFRGIVR